MSGDNDVGGETIRDRREAWKVERFQRHFPRSDVTTVMHVDFVNVRKRKVGVSQSLVQVSVSLDILLF